MKYSLAYKWIGTLLVTSLVGVVLVGVVATQATNNAFDQLKIDEARSEYTDIAEAYYVTNQSWMIEIDEELAELPGTLAEQQRLPIPPGGLPGGPRGQGQGNNRGSNNNRLPFSQTVQQDGSAPPPQFVVVDSNSHVVWPGGPYQVGERVSRREFESGTEIMVEDEVVGRVVFLGGTPQLDSNDERYLETTTQALLVGAGGASVIALLVGVILAGHFTRPLRELTAAIRAMRSGDLEQEVPVRTKDELGELSAAFNQMSAELHQANQLRRQMTADIAHDLRTPLTVIAGYLEGLRDGTLEMTSERLNTMYKEATQLKRLIEDLRTLSLADAGELPLRTQVVAPDALLQDVAASFDGLAAEKAIGLDVVIQDTLPDVVIDPERMTQVFANLVSNAIRHTPERGKIRLQARAYPHMVEFIVADTGEGIPADKLPYIFERFYRSDGSRHQTAGETGLGLAIARSIVEAHGGNIQVQSELGHGTRMHIRLPADDNST